MVFKSLVAGVLLLAPMAAFASDREPDIVEIPRYIDFEPGSQEERAIDREYYATYNERVSANAQKEAAERAGIDAAERLAKCLMDMKYLQGVFTDLGGYLVLQGGGIATFMPPQLKPIGGIVYYTGGAVLLVAIIAKNGGDFICHKLTEPKEIKYFSPPDPVGIEGPRKGDSPHKDGGMIYD